MTEEVLHHDDQSHYEVSLTAGQAFLAFVLLLLSLAASFAFGLLIGKGQSDERLVVRKEPAVISEAPTALASKRTAPIPELGVSADDFQQTPAVASHDAQRQAATSAQDPAAITPVITDGSPSMEISSANSIAVPPARTAAVSAPNASFATPPSVVTPPARSAVKPASSGPAYAQILSTADQKTADALAAKLIDGGFNSAYVERSVTEKGTAFRVRVKFPSESEARAHEIKLREFSKDVWIVK